MTEEEVILPVMMGRVYDKDTFPPKQRELWDSFLASGERADMTQIYPGSVVKTCQECGVQIAIGPRQTQVYDESPESFALMCPLCTARAAVETGQSDVPVINFNNPHEFKKD